MHTSSLPLGIKEKIAIASLLGIAFLLGIYSTVSLSRQSKQNIPRTQYQTLPPESLDISSSVSLVPDQTTQSINQPFDISIQIDTGQQKVQASDIVLVYDPLYLRPVSISSGSFFQNILRKDITTPGIISISALAQIQDNILVIPKGKGTIATISFLPITETSDTSLSFDREKTVIASSGKNILSQSHDAHISIIQ